jgi:DNA-directed RNA polymerase subunit RPC12/RpoP
MTVYRCTACGNKTRFDVYESKRVRAFYHFTLAGVPSVEEEEVLERTIERIECRWCGSKDDVVEEQAILGESAESEGG